MKSYGNLPKEDLETVKKQNMDLQLFAEEEPVAQEPGTTEESPAAGSPEKAGDAALEAKLEQLLEQKFSQRMKAWEAGQQKKSGEAAKLAEMNAQERAEYERDQLQKQLDELTRKNVLAEMTKTARSMLAEKEITVEDAVLEMLVSDDAEKTKATVNAFAKAFRSAVETAVKDKLRGAPPKRGAPAGSSVTREQILAVKNRAERQRLISEHMELFK